MAFEFKLSNKNAIPKHCKLQIRKISFEPNCYHGGILRIYGWTRWTLSLYEINIYNELFYYQTSKQILQFYVSGRMICVFCVTLLSIEIYEWIIGVGNKKNNFS